jgi:hypothetical protein
VGWQDRDWAKLRDDELAALYSFRKSSRPEPRSSIRTIVWSGVVLLALAVAGFAYSQLPQSAIGSHAPALPPAVVYGELGTFFGESGACTEFELLATGSWRCDTFQPDDGPALLHTRFARAAPYDGPCTHLKVDQTSAHWVCLSIAPPTAPDGVDR